METLVQIAERVAKVTHEKRTWGNGPWVTPQRLST